MIPNQWYAVLESDEVRPGKPVGVVRMSEKLVFWRDSHGHVTCQRDLCAHRGAALSFGRVLGDTVQCPFHGLRYEQSGRCVLIPANGRSAPVPERFKLHTYPTMEGNGFIYIWWGDARPDLPPAPFFTDIGGDFSYVTARDPWTTHYSRCIENQLDTVHLPFVHYNTIGRGNRTVVNGPRTVWLDDDSFQVYVNNQADTGQTPAKPDGVRTDVPFHLEFRFPNLWQNHISEDLRIVVAFVPVDQQNTILYLRYYQRFVRLPVLRDIVNFLSLPFNLIVAHQDRRVVQTQRPIKTALRLGENLIQGDNPVVAYRMRRAKLLELNGAPETPAGPA
jgi:phenylpropionate dioxygenase-like ring-hydroxylating dioxygenase large terminal subunit